jgi:tyrosyl-tRNA synthetase
MIGDPDGKKQERDLKSADEVARNKEALAKQYEKIFDGQEFDLVDNYDWFKDFKYLDFLREIGKHASMTQMLDRDFVQSRIGQGGEGISYAEFSYSLIQGYDFLHLFREKGATLQVAGADQWGNSIMGVQLIRRLEAAEAHVFTTPLIINKSTGVKFGKSEAGAIWLDPEKTSPYKFYQFWLNTDDETAEDLIKIYTLLSRQEVERVIQDHRAQPSERGLQKRLAQEVTSIVHGPERTESVKKVTGVLFGSMPVHDLSASELDELAAEIPVSSSNELIEVLVGTGLATSNGDARRLIEGGAISVNNEKHLSATMLTSPALIKKGKNGFALLR